MNKINQNEREERKKKKRERGKREREEREEREKENKLYQIINQQNDILQEREKEVQIKLSILLVFLLVVSRIVQTFL